MENNEEELGTEAPKLLEHESGLKYQEVTYEGEKLRIFASDDAARLEFEEFNEYKFRRSVSNYLNKRARQGHMFWPSRIPIKVPPYYMGNTYNKKKAEQIREQLLKQQENGE